MDGSRVELHGAAVDDFACLADDTEPLQNHFPMEEIVVENTCARKNDKRVAERRNNYPEPELSRPTTEIANEDEYMHQLSELLDNGREREFARRVSQRRPASVSQAVGGLTLLQRAAHAGLARAVTVLLVRAAADPNAAAPPSASGGEERCPPLVLAAREGRWDAVEALLTGGGPSLDADAADAGGDSALHHAARAARLDVVLLLLRRGADARRRNLRGDAPFGPAEARALLDRCVSCGRDRELAFDYRLLAPGPGERGGAQQQSNGPEAPCAEMDFVMQLAESEATVPLLGHPVVRSFLECKWKHVRTSAYAEFLFKLMYVLLIDVLVVCAGMNLYHPPWRYYSYIGTFAAGIGFIFLVVFNEWCDICMWLALAVSIGSAVCISLKEDVIDFIALAVLSSSFILLLEYGRLPLFTYPVQLMKSVAKQYVQFLLPFILLILMLSLGFHIIHFHEITKRRVDPTNVESWSISMVKTFLIVANSHSTNYPQSILIYTYVLVLGCSSVILLYILIGLTVPCVQKINSVAEEIKLFAKARKIYKAEMFRIRLACSPLCYWVKFCSSVFLFPSAEIDRIGRASLKSPNSTHLIVGGRSYTVSKDIFLHALQIVEDFSTPSAINIKETFSVQQLVQEEMAHRLKNIDEKIEERFRVLETKLEISSQRHAAQLQSSLRSVDNKIDSIFSLLDRQFAS